MASIKKIKGKNGISYKITVSCGYDVYGKKLIETATFNPEQTLTPKKMERAAADFAREFEQQVRNGAALDGRKITLKEFSERWLDEYAKPKLQAGTVEKYTEIFDNIILPAIGHHKLFELKPHVLNSFLLSLSKDGARKDGRDGGYSKGSITKVLNVLSSVLRTASEWEVIERNPCDKVRITADNAADKIKFFTPEQASAWLAFIEQPYSVTIGGHRRVDDTGKPYTVGEYETTREIQEQIKILFNLAVYTGLRKGELLALQWSDIDFENDKLTVSKAAAMVGGEQVCKAPKTKTSFRTVTFPHFLNSRLKQLRQETIERRLLFGDTWQGSDWVFTQENGKMLCYSTPYQALRDSIKRYNARCAASAQLPNIPFHGLRHTSATLLIASKQDLKTVSNRLGHAQTSTTMNIYAHALQDNDKKATNALESILQNEKSSAKVAK